MIAVAVPAPLFRLVYAGREITADIRPFVLSVSYTDNLHGESDQVEVELDDSDGRWRSAWYPAKGDELELSVGYQGSGVLDCGLFQVDEVELSGPPHQLSLRALATGSRETTRTRRSRAFESLTLAQVVQRVADEHGFEVVGEIEPIELGRCTQLQESDLAFLTRLASAYGHCFSVRGQQLVFHRLELLDAAEQVLVLQRQDLISYSLKDQSRTAYRAAVLTYQDPGTGELVQQEVAAAGGAARADVLRINVRAESPAQAEARARAALAAAQRRNVEGRLVIPGEPRAVAGVRLGLQGLGALDGVYQVKRSVHGGARGEGYRTTCEVQRA